MAEIPVERKQGGIPWWIPLLLLLLLIPVLFFLFRGCNAAPVANVNTNGNTNRIVNMTNANNVGAATNVNTGMNSSNANTPTISVDNKGTAAGAKITDIAALAGNDRNSFVGRGADLSGVKVNRVLSDRVFTVTAGSNEMFMMLDDKLNAGGKEQQIRIKSGQTLNLDGEFRNVPTGEVKNEVQNRDLNSKEYAQMKGQQVYLHVNSVSDVK
jgi:hypothetical protein